MGAMKMILGSPFLEKLLKNSFNVFIYSPKSNECLTTKFHNPTDKTILYIHDTIYYCKVFMFSCNLVYVQKY